MRTKVAIIGAGPAGMFLAHTLRADGIDAVVIERRDRGYVEGRVRAGVLEQVSVDLMARLGLDARLKRDGLVHGGTNLSLDGDLFRIDMAALTGGSTVTVYGQQEVMKDLFDAVGPRGLEVVWDADDVRLHDLDTDAPYVTWTGDGVDQRLDCDFVADATAITASAAAASRPTCSRRSSASIRSAGSVFSPKCRPPSMN